jgi:hypothetical protein
MMKNQMESILKCYMHVLVGLIKVPKSMRRHAIPCVRLNGWNRYSGRISATGKWGALEYSNPIRGTSPLFQKNTVVDMIFQQGGVAIGQWAEYFLL